MKAATNRIALAIILANGVCATAAIAADGPVRRTTQYQTSSPPVGASTYDRYAAPVAGQNTYGPPPNVLNSTQAAATDAGNSLRREFDTGVQQLNNEATRVSSRASDMGQGASDQLRNSYDYANRQVESAANGIGSATQQTVVAANDGLRQAGDAVGINGSAPPPGLNYNARNVSGQSGGSLPPYTPQTSSPSPWSSASSPSSPLPNTSGQPSAPPLATGGAGSGFNSPTAPRSGGTTTPASGWSSLDRDTAPPAMRAPTDVNASSVGASSFGTPRPVAAVSNSQGALGSAFPSSPAPPVSAPPSIHSQLLDPGQPYTAASGGTQSPPNWKDDWNLPAGGGGALQSMPAGSTAGNDSFNRGPAMGDPANGAGRIGPPPAISRQDSFGNNSQPAKAGAANDWGFGQPNQQQMPGALINAQNVSQNQGSPGLPAIGGGQTAGGAKAGNGKTPDKTMATEVESFGDKPWMPLVFVSLTLISSLGANLFLGWSYVDARQKYRTLVRNTADKFRRAVEAA